MAMPKMKTNSGAKKRFSFTATGKIKFKKAKHSHLLTSKTTKSKREMRRTGILRKGDAGLVKNLLPNG
jgi:large subunit ribosomal protein L35